MRIAAIADVHGNRAALEAVLEDIDARGVDLIVNLGDHLSGPLDARGTAAILMSRDMICIRGNHDRWLLEVAPADMNASDRAANRMLGPDQRRWLAALPMTATVAGEVFLCHGTPSSDTTYWTETVEPDGRVRAASPSEAASSARGIGAALMLCGHTHLPRVMTLQGGQLLVNPGSVGCPGYTDEVPVPHVMESGTSDACYALLERRGGRWTVEPRSVAYDAREMVRLAESGGRADWATALATGRVA